MILKFFKQKRLLLNTYNIIDIDIICGCIFNGLTEGGDLKLILGIVDKILKFKKEPYNEKTEYNGI